MVTYGEYLLAMQPASRDSVLHALYEALPPERVAALLLTEVDLQEKAPP